MKSYVVLLRGINVGGKNRVPMAELKAHLEAMRCENVQTYIASGNVILKSDKSKAVLASSIEKILPQKFKLDSELIKVLVLSHADLQKAIRQAPKGFGSEPVTYHSDVVFLMGITPKTALKVFDPREGVDKVWPGDLAIYSQRLSAQRTKSRLSKIVGTSSYKSMTIRTWNTVQKLMNLLSALESRPRV